MKYHLIFVRKTIIFLKKAKESNDERPQRNIDFCIFLGKRQTGEAAVVNTMENPQRRSLPYDPAFSLLGTDPKEFTLGY